MQRILLETVDSTNEEAKRLFHDGKIMGLTYLLAKAQTAGKGTQGRVWVSPENAGIYLSVVHQPDEQQVIPMTTEFTRAAGVACAEVMKEYLGLNIQLKPVNDLYFEGRKLGGILTESLVQQDKVKALITGIGINVSKAELLITDQKIAPVSLEEILAPHVYQQFAHQEFCDALVTCVHHWYQTLFEKRPAPLEQAWNSYVLSPLGREQP